MSTLRDKDVCGFDVAVDNALGMCSVQRVCNLDGERKNQLGFHRSPAKPCVPSLSEHVLAEQDPVPRRTSELLDGTCWKGHERPLRQDQRGRSVSQGMGRAEWFWLRVAFSCTECTENRRKS